MEEPATLPLSVPAAWKAAVVMPAGAVPVRVGRAPPPPLSIAAVMLDNQEQKEKGRKRKQKGKTRGRGGKEGRTGFPQSPGRASPGDLTPTD